MIISCADLPTPVLPPWSRGRVLTGDIRRPKVIDFDAVMASVYLHPSQTGKKTRLSGHDILDSLVASYKEGEDKVGNTYEVSPTDLIHGHFGLAELTYMEDIQDTTLPEPFKVWAKDKLLYGWRDVVWYYDVGLRVPCLSFRVVRPRVHWYDLDYSLSGDVEPGLRELIVA